MGTPAAETTPAAAPPVTSIAELRAQEPDLKIDRSRQRGRSRSPKGDSRAPAPGEKVFGYGRGTESKLYGVQCSVANDPRKPWYKRAEAAASKQGKPQIIGQ